MCTRSMHCTNSIGTQRKINKFVCVKCKCGYDLLSMHLGTSSKNVGIITVFKSKYDEVLRMIGFIEHQEALDMIHSSPSPSPSWNLEDWNTSILHHPQCHLQRYWSHGSVAIALKNARWPDRMIDVVDLTSGFSRRIKPIRSTLWPRFPTQTDTLPRTSLCSRFDSLDSVAKTQLSRPPQRLNALTHGGRI